MTPLPTYLTCPEPTHDSPLTVDVVTAGNFDTRWEWVEGAGKKGPVSLPLLVGVVHHPDGTILVDAGLGKTTRAGAWPRFPFKGFKVNVPDGAAMVEQVQNPLRVLLTHNHYDHVGGLFDFPGLEVWTALDDLRGGRLPADLRRTVNFVGKDLRDGVVGRALGRPAIDVMGDGTVWYIGTPGHTRGAASVLVRAKNGQFLFVGDTAWVDDHLAYHRRPELISWFADDSRADLESSLAWSRWLYTHCHDTQVVAGHEPKWRK